MMVGFFFISVLLYSFALLFAAKVWNKMLEIKESGELKSVSVLVPIRNETKNLQRLLDNLSKIQYPYELLEIILVDDHSRDQPNSTFKRAEKYFPYQIKLLHLDENGTGKKSAIMKGVSIASGELILTTDADCLVPSDWVQKMQAPFEISSTQLVSGSVVFADFNFLSQIFQMEFAPLIGIGAVSIDLGMPTMANGANLAFRKSTFEKLQPYSDNMSIPSGDDVFLVKKIKAAYPDPESMFFQKDSTVETDPPANFTSFYWQRKRWSAKWRASARKYDSLPALLVWSFHLLYITCLMYAVVNKQFTAILPILLWKAISEGIFISLILKSQGKRFRLSVFLILQMFYSLYVLIFGLLANFGSYQWKERKYSSNERTGN